jgi:hypothetical protein
MHDSTRRTPRAARVMGAVADSMGASPPDASGFRTVEAEGATVHIGPTVELRPADADEGPPPPPNWLPAWTRGSWVKRGREEQNEKHRAWFAALSEPLRALFLRHPPGSVVELAGSCLFPRSVEGFALAPWTTRHGIVIGYLEPTPELQELGVPPEGALVLLESPDPSAACQGVVFEAEVARTVGYLHGYDPAAARANLLGPDGQPRQGVPETRAAAPAEDGQLPPAGAPTSGA